MKHKKPYRPEWAKKPKKPLNPTLIAMLYSVVTILFFFVLYIYAWHAGQSAGYLAKARFLQELLPSLTFIGVVASWTQNRAKSLPSRTALFILEAVPWLYGFGLLLVLK